MFKTISIPPQPISIIPHTPIPLRIPLQPKLIHIMRCDHRFPIILSFLPSSRGISGVGPPLPTAGVVAAAHGEAGAHGIAFDRIRIVRGVVLVDFAVLGVEVVVVFGAEGGCVESAR